jgi:hypothetical protein
MEPNDGAMRLDAGENAESAHFAVDAKFFYVAVDAIIAVAPAPSGVRYFEHCGPHTAVMKADATNS